jgi:hypothetical protein
MATDDESKRAAVTTSFFISILLGTEAPLTNPNKSS